MRASARNRLKGKNVGVTMGAATAHVTIDVGGRIVAAAITRELVEDLALAPGVMAHGLITASDMMVGTD